MKFVLFPLSVFLSLICLGQPGSKRMKGEKLLANDSIVMKLKQIKDSIASSGQAHDTVQVAESIDQNMNYILQFQKDQRTKQKKAAIIRIVIGLVLLVLLIVGLRRKTVKK